MEEPAIEPPFDRRPTHEEHPAFLLLKEFHFKLNELVHVEAGSCLKNYQLLPFSNLATEIKAKIDKYIKRPPV